MEARVKNTDNTLIIQKDVRWWSGAQGQRDSKASLSLTTACLRSFLVPDIS